MRRRLCLLLALCLCLTGCSGLPTPREMGDMALLRTMGVDQVEDMLQMTVSTGPRAKGLQGEGQEALVLTAEESSLSGAALELQGQSDSYVSFGHVDQLLVGEELALRDVTGVLDYFARDRELGLGAQLWVIRGESARAAVESGGSQGIDGRLSTLRTDGRMGFAQIPRTAGEVYADLLERGSAYVPALGLISGENPRLEERGYAILKDDRLVGYLEGDSARGLELLANKATADVLEIQLPGQKVTTQITRAATVSRFSSGGESLSITCRVWAQLVEYSHVPGEEELVALQEEIGRQEKQRVEAALTQLCGWQADCLGLGAKAGMLAPGLWSVLAEEWPNRFGEQTFHVALTVELTR